MGRQYQAVPEAFTTIHAAYAAALKRAPLDGDTRRAYDSRVRTFLTWLEASGLDGDPLTDAHDRDFAIRDYKTHMKTVLRRASNTVNAHLTALESGEIDAQILSRPQLVGPLKGAGDIVVDQVPGTGLTAFTLRTDQPPFDRKENRQAVAYALDRPGVNTTIYDSVGTLGNDHLFAALFPAAPDDLPQRAKDPAKVADLLGGQQFSFDLTFDPPGKDLALTLQNQLKQAGIEVRLDQRTSADFYGGDQEKDTPWLFTAANLVGWAGRAVPSQFIIPMVRSDGVWNGSKYANPALDEAARAYDAATTEEERRAQAAIIANALHEDVPVIISVWAGTVRAYKALRSGRCDEPQSNWEPCLRFAT